MWIVLHEIEEARFPGSPLRRWESSAPARRPTTSLAVESAHAYPGWYAALDAQTALIDQTSE